MGNGVSRHSPAADILSRNQEKTVSSKTKRVRSSSIGTISSNIFYPRHHREWLNGDISERMDPLLFSAEMFLQELSSSKKSMAPRVPNIQKADTSKSVHSDDSKWVLAGSDRNRVLGDYFEIGESRSDELGRGHYGVVKKAISKATGQTVAVKTVQKQKPSDVAMLRNELFILGLVDHENVVKLLDVFETESCCR